jgi:hypothetical protein
MRRSSAAALRIADAARAADTCAEFDPDDGME